MNLKMIDLESRKLLLFKTLLPLFFLIFYQNSSVAQSIDNYSEKQNYYQSGMAFIEAGNLEKALQTWEMAYKNNSDPDLNIGISFIELVAENSMKDHYKLATEIYYWSLSADSIQGFKKALEKELEFLSPLIEYKKLKSLKDKLKQDDSSILSDIYGFWKEKDPTPLTVYNERLIEHWTRIASSKEHYVYNSSGDLDSRGEIYIRFGKPSYSKQGMLIYNPMFVNRLIKERLSVSRLNTSQFSHSAAEMLRFNLETQVRQLHNNPRFEVWIYSTLNDKIQDTIFLFGSVEGGDDFKKLNAVEDFIPSTAYRTLPTNLFAPNLSQQSDQFSNTTSSNTNNQGLGSIRSINSIGNAQLPETDITPALIFQIMYYRQLAALDPYFGSTYDNMLNRYSRLTSRISRSLAREFESQNIGKLVNIEQAAPDEKSTYVESKSQISLEYHTYRFIDDENKPYVKLFLEVDPGQSILYDHLLSTNRLSNAINYKLRNGVLILNKYKQESKVVEDLVILPSDINLNRSIVSEFDIYQSGEENKLIGSSQLEKVDSEQEEEIKEGVFENNIKGIGRKEISTRPPLDTKKMQMGDIILGFGLKKNPDQKNFVPFNISHHHTIPKGEQLKIYYELYQLEQSPGEKSSYTFSYTINKKTEGLRIFRNKEKRLNITLNMETLGNRDEQVLEIDTSSFETGKYNLELAITDINSGEQLEKFIEFSIE